MYRLFRLILVFLFLFLPLWVCAIEVKQSEDPLVSKGDIKLTNAYVKQVFSSDVVERKNAVISTPQRFQKYIENRWIELNLINQFEHGAVPEDMPALDQLMALIKRTTIAKVMIQKLAEDEGVGLDAAAREYYMNNLSKYKLADKVRASHILIKSDKRTDEEARALGEKIRNKAVSGKRSFADLAQKYSEDPSVQTNYGDLGLFGRGQMAKPFEETVFAMEKPGEISPVVKTQFGYHIIRFEEKQIGKTKPYSAVQKSIKDELTAKRQQTIWKQYEDKAKSTKTKLVSNDEVASWLWFGGMDNSDHSDSAWKQTANKLAIARLLESRAQESMFDQSQIVKQKLASAKRKGLVKLRRKALFDAIAKRDLETAVKEQYIVNKDKYIVPLQVDVSMIFLAKKKYSEEKIIRLADSIYQQLISGNSDFEEMVVKYSDAPGVNKNKGRMGLRKRGELGKELDAAIFVKKQPGMINPIETSAGVFIVNVNEIHPQHQLSFDEVRDSIKTKLVNNLADQEYTLLVQSILNSPDNIVNHEALDSLYAELKKSM